MAFFPDPEQSGHFVPDIPAIAAALPAAPQAVVALQRRMGIREPRIKDEQFLQNVGKAAGELPYDVGGAVTDVTGSPLAGSLAAGVAEVGPYALGGFGAGKALAGLAKAGGERLMQIAIKPSKAARDSGDAIKAVKTLLEEGANVSEGGVAKLTEKINGLDAELAQVIQNATGNVLNTNVLQTLRGLMKQYESGTLASNNLEKIREVSNHFLKHPFFRGGDEMAVQAAQAMKRQNYRELGDAAYGMGLKPMAERDALKQINRGLAGEIKRVAPEAGPLNAQMSPLINARDLAQERVLAAGNRNLVGLGILNPKTLAWWLADRSPLAASLAARGLYSGVSSLAPSLGAAAGGAIGDYPHIFGQPTYMPDNR